MWSDNETTLDLLGFKVHADLITNVATDTSLLPITIGVFGDWGGGKTSVMKMIQYNLDPENYAESSSEKAQFEKVACLYFNGWLFEGYDDAKAALISTILIQLANHKRFGPKIKESASELLESVDWMRLARLGFTDVAIPATMAYLTGGASFIPSIVSLVKTVLSQVKGNTEVNPDGSEKPTVDLKTFLKEKKTSPSPMDVRTFRDKFSKMLADSDIKTLVVLIDDLDRCSAKRIIDNLEAIKLFLSVDHTAFVIGADLRIVRHAISTIYNPESIKTDGGELEAQTDILTDYIEKLIQVPYRLPRLSPAEVETYMAMLFCHQYLNLEEFNRIHQALEEFRKRNRYSVFGYGAINAKLGTLAQDLASSLIFCSKVAPLITEGLKGNPRQVKRFLNAYILRKKLAQVAQITDMKDDVLVKLMVLEYAHSTQFNQVYRWQASQDGKPNEIKDLEKILCSTNGITGREEEVKKINTEWTTPFLCKWVAMEPYLSEVDFRDYYWVARDRLQSSMSDVSMIPPIIRLVLEDLLANNPARNRNGVEAISALQTDEVSQLISLLSLNAQRHSSERAPFNGLRMLIEADVPGSIDAFIDCLRSSPPEQLEPSLGIDILTLLKSKPELVYRFTPIIDELKITKSRIAAALKPGKEDSNHGDIKKLPSAN